MLIKVSEFLWDGKKKHNSFWEKERDIYLKLAEKTVLEMMIGVSNISSSSLLLVSLVVIQYFIYRDVFLCRFLSELNI